MIRVDEPGGLEDPLRDLLGGLDAGVDRIDHADEDPPVAGGVLADDPQHALAVGLARELDEEVMDVHPEQRREEIGVVDVGAVCGVPVTPRARVDTDARAFVGGELAEDLVIEVHECREQSARRIELEREPGFGEVDLGARTPSDDPAQLVRCLRDQVVDERLARVALDPVARVHQADRRGRDDRLLEWRARLVARAVEIRVRLRRVAERGRREDRQLPGMSVLEGDGHAAGGQRQARPRDRSRSSACAAPHP
jgi:hypothetical protein